MIGTPILQAWGMTETSPVASTGRVKSSLDHLSEDEKADVRTSIGIISVGVDFRVVGPDGEPAPVGRRDLGRAPGRRAVDRPGVLRRRRGLPSRSPRTAGCAPATWPSVEPTGYIRLVDRTKDVVKSGGEWISSVELENEIMGHPKVAEAAVIGIPHPKWSERPLACVVVKPGEDLTREEVLEHLDGKVAKWWVPDDVVFIDEVPKTSVGKFSKKDLRDPVRRSPAAVSRRRSERSELARTQPYGTMNVSLSTVPAGGLQSTPTGVSSGGTIEAWAVTFRKFIV